MDLASIKTKPELLAALDRARDHIMTPKERYTQRRSMVLGEIRMSHPDLSEPEAEALADQAVGPDLSKSYSLEEVEALLAAERERAAMVCITAADEAEDAVRAYSGSPSIAGQLWQRAKSARVLAAAIRSLAPQTIGDE